MLCASIICGFAGSESQFLKTGVAEDRLPKMSPKFAPHLRARAIWKSKSLQTGTVGALLEVQVAKICTRAIWKSTSLKSGSLGALLEVEVAKICTTPARQSDFEVKIVKNWRAGSGHFRKLKSPKFAPSLRARAIWKSKPLKHQVLGTFFEVHNFRCARPGKEFRQSILIQIAQTYCNSEVKCLVNMSFFREFSQNSFS